MPLAGPSDDKGKGTVGRKWTREEYFAHTRNRHHASLLQEDVDKIRVRSAQGSVRCKISKRQVHEDMKDLHLTTGHVRSPGGGHGRWDAYFKTAKQNTTKATATRKPLASSNVSTQGNITSDNKEKEKVVKLGMFWGGTGLDESVEADRQAFSSEKSTTNCLISDLSGNVTEGPKDNTNKEINSSKDTEEKSNMVMQISSTVVETKPKKKGITLPLAAFHKIKPDTLWKPFPIAKQKDQAQDVCNISKEGVYNRGQKQICRDDDLPQYHINYSSLARSGNIACPTSRRIIGRGQLAKPKFMVKKESTKKLFSKSLSIAMASSKFKAKQVLINKEPEEKPEEGDETKEISLKRRPKSAPPIDRYVRAVEAGLCTDYLVPSVDKIQVPISTAWVKNQRILMSQPKKLEHNGFKLEKERAKDIQKRVDAFLSSFNQEIVK